MVHNGRFAVMGNYLCVIGLDIMNIKQLLTIPTLLCKYQPLSPPNHKPVAKYRQI